MQLNASVFLKAGFTLSVGSLNGPLSPAPYVGNRKRAILDALLDYWNIMTDKDKRKYSKDSKF